MFHPPPHRALGRVGLGMDLHDEGALCGVGGLRC